MAIYNYFNKKRQNNIYQDQDPNMNMYSQQGSTGMTGMESTQMAPTQPQSQGQGYNPMNSMGWFGYANQAKDLGKSMIKYNDDGTIANKEGQVFNELITPDHENMIKQAKEGDWKGVLAESTGLPKFFRAFQYGTGSTSSTGKQGNFNKTINMFPMGGKQPCYACGGMHKYMNGGMPNAEGNPINNGNTGVNNPNLSPEMINYILNNMKKDMKYKRTIEDIPMGYKKEVKPLYPQIGFKKTLTDLPDRMLPVYQDSLPYNQNNQEMKFANGGEVPREFANSEIEKQENVLYPDGGFYQADGPSHDDGGVPVNLPGDSMIFSDRLKPVGSKKTYAQLNKVNNTNKEDKILEGKSINKISRSTAELMKYAKNKASQDLFDTQESHKVDKVNKYAQRLGVTTPTATNVDANEGMGTEETFAKGGRFMGINPAHKGYCTPMTKPTCTGHRRALALTLKKHQGFHKHEMGGVQPYPAMDSPYKELKKPFPIYYGGGRHKNDPNNINDLTPREQGEYQNWFNQGSQNDPEFNPDNYSLSQYRSIFNPISQDGSNSTPSVQNTKTGRSVNWGDVAGNAGMFLANNAGNIYNLSRYNKPEVETYERAKASYLDPTAAIRDANQEARLAERGIRNASGGNAANYLSNRVALNAQNIMNKDRIRQQYANANAGIGNQVNQFNTQLAQQEVIANAQNRARVRSGKGEAIGSMGYNTANQIRDNKMGNMDQATLDIMMKYYNTPEFQKLMKDNKFKK